MRLLIIDPDGGDSIRLLALLKEGGVVEYSHVVTDNPSARDIINRDNLTNDYTMQVGIRSLERIADQYRGMNKEFHVVVLAGANPDQPSLETLIQWNAYLRACMCMLDIADAKVICITDHRIEPDLVNAPDRCYVVRTHEEAFETIHSLAA